jgi:predicted nucleic acid-binding protein
LSYLLDTNVIAEALKPKPDRNVAGWLATVPEERFHLSVLTLGEIRKGVEGLPASARKERIREWLEVALPQRFEARLLAIDASVTDRWGRMLAELGRPVPAIDSLIAATALTHGLSVLTRNVKHFRFPGLRVIDPFGAKAP